MKKMFSKERKDKKPHQKKLRSQIAAKHGTYSAVLVLIVVAALVIVNILATAVAARYPTTIDLSSSKQNSVSSENVDYLKSVDKEVNVVVCATEDGYTGSYMQGYAYNYYKAQDSTGSYYKQTVHLLEMYEKYNKNINISYSDPDATAFAAVQKIVPSTTLAYGDILVYCTFNNAEGKEITNTKVLSFADVYDLQDETGYAAYGGVYTVSGSKLETALTGAIYSVTSEQTYKVAYLSGHCATDYFDTLSANLEINNYEITNVDTEIVSAIDDDISAVVIAAPKTDFAASEIEVLESFLENGGKSLIVFCDSDCQNLPNLYAFLEEWGITCEPDYNLFETDENNYISGDPTTMGFVNKNTDYSSAVNKSGKIYISGRNVPMTTSYTSLGSRTTNVLLSTQGTVVAAPLGTDYNWTPTADFEKKAYAASILTTDTTYDDNNVAHTSYVLAFSSADFISAGWTQYSAVGNVDFATALFNKVCGKNDSDIFFNTKTVASFVFKSQPTALATSLVRTMFIIVLPVVLIACGIVIWYRRKNR